MPQKNLQTYALQSYASQTYAFKKIKKCRINLQ